VQIDESEFIVDREKRRKLNMAAEAVRRALNINSPKDLWAAIERIGGEIKPCQRIDPHEASIVKTDDAHFEIRLDGTKAETRQLFSLAHELGHLFIHMGYANPERWGKVSAYTAYRRKGFTEEEFEANEFAAALLMPESAFRAAAKSHPVERVSRQFGVSVDAALNRGRWLGIYPWS
jgi:Zn-dependent peptidase ImmA (M78 family)